MAKMKMSTAAPSRKSAHHIPTKHLTTLSLTDFRPTNIIPVRAGDRVHVNFFQKSYTKPLAVPTFGSFKIKTYSYFCPWRVIWRGYEGFIDDSTDASVPKTPIELELRDLMEIILNAYGSGTGDYTGEYEQISVPFTDPNAVLPYPDTHDFEVLYTIQSGGGDNQDQAKY